MVGMSNSQPSPVTHIVYLLRCDLSQSRRMDYAIPTRDQLRPARRFSTAIRSLIPSDLFLKMRSRTYRKKGQTSTIHCPVALGEALAQQRASSSDTNDKGQCPVELKELFVIDVPDVFADSFHGNCHDLIHHDLGRLGQPILG